MRDTTFLYCLTEPGTKEIRYFGVAVRPKIRLGRHKHDAKGLQTHSAHWIKKLQAGGQAPDMHILCEVPSNDFARFERAFITIGRQSGFRLTNHTDGGEGTPGHKQSRETIEKRAVKLRGIKRTSAQSAAQSLRQTGRPGTKHTQEWCTAQREKMLGKKKSPAHCLALLTAQQERRKREKEAKRLA